MFLPTVLVLLSASSLVLGVVPFRARNCNGVTNATESLDLKYVKVKSHPIKVPGVFQAAIKIQVKKTLDPSIKYDVEFKIYRYLIYKWVHVPCVDKYGSCTYDLCPFLDHYFKGGCPEALTKAGFPCKCDQFANTQLKTYTIPMSKFTFPKSFLPTSLVYGDYKVSIRIREHDSKALRHCVHLQLSLAASDGACDSIFCDVIG